MIVSHWLKRNSRGCSGYTFQMKNTFHFIHKRFEQQRITSNVIWIDMLTLPINIVGGRNFQNSVQNTFLLVRSWTRTAWQFWRQSEETKNIVFQRGSSPTTVVGSLNVLHICRKHVAINLRDYLKTKTFCFDIFE